MRIPTPYFNKRDIPAEGRTHGETHTERRTRRDTHGETHTKGHIWGAYTQSAIH